MLSNQCKCVGEALWINTPLRVGGWVGGKEEEREEMSILDLQQTFFFRLPLCDESEESSRELWLMNSNPES